MFPRPIKSYSKYPSQNSVKPDIQVSKMQFEPLLGKAAYKVVHSAQKIPNNAIKGLKDIFFKENETTSRQNPRPENYQEHTLCSTGTYCTPRS